MAAHCAGEASWSRRQRAELQTSSSPASWASRQTTQCRGRPELQDQVLRHCGQAAAAVLPQRAQGDLAKTGVKASKQTGHSRASSFGRKVLPLPSQKDRPQASRATARRKSVRRVALRTMLC